MTKRTPTLYYNTLPLLPKVSSLSSLINQIYLFYILTTVSVPSSPPIPFTSSLTTLVPQFHFFFSAHRMVGIPRVDIPTKCGISSHCRTELLSLYWYLRSQPSMRNWFKKPVKMSGTGCAVLSKLKVLEAQVRCLCGFSCDDLDPLG